MNIILQKYLVFIKLNQFMTSYIGHAHIHLTAADKKNLSLETLQNLETSPYR